MDFQSIMNNGDWSLENRFKLIKHIYRQAELGKHCNSHFNQSCRIFSVIPEDLQIKIINKMTPKTFARTLRCSRSIYIVSFARRHDIKIHGIFSDSLSMMNPKLAFRLFNFHDNPYSVQLEWSLQCEIINMDHKVERRTKTIFKVEMDYFIYEPLYAMDLSFFYYPDICIDLEMHGGLLNKDFIPPIANFIDHIGKFNLACEKLTFRESVPEIRKVERKRSDSPEGETTQEVECPNVHKLGCKLQAMDLFVKTVEAIPPRMLRIELGTYFQLENHITTQGLRRINQLILKLNNSENLFYDFPHIFEKLLPIATVLDITIYRDNYKDTDGGYLPEVIWPQIVTAIQKIQLSPSVICNRELHLSMEDLDIPYSVPELFYNITNSMVYEFPNWGSLSLVVVPISNLQKAVIVALFQPSFGLPSVGKPHLMWSQCHWHVATNFKKFCDFVTFYSSCGQNLIDRQRERFDLIQKTYF